MTRDKLKVHQRDLEWTFKKLVQTMFAFVSNHARKLRGPRLLRSLLLRFSMVRSSSLIERPFQTR